MLCEWLQYQGKADFLIEFLKWYFSKYWQVRTRQVFTQTVTYVLCLCSWCNLHCTFNALCFVNFRWVTSVLIYRVRAISVLIFTDMYFKYLFKVRRTFFLFHHLSTGVDLRFSEKGVIVVVDLTAINWAPPKLM